MLDMNDKNVLCELLLFLLDREGGMVMSSTQHMFISNSVTGEHIHHSTRLLQIVFMNH